MNNLMEPMKATTIICVRRGEHVAIAGDGQVTLGQSIMKNNARKVRKIYEKRVITGFAGAVADAFTLYEKMEEKLGQYRGDLTKSCVELTREWRTDKYLRRLEAMMLVADQKKTFLLSGNGEVIEPEHEVMAIGSGGDFARSAALALYQNTDLSPAKIAKKSLEIAGEICIYTNLSIHVEEIK